MLVYLSFQFTCCDLYDHECNKFPQLAMERQTFNSYFKGYARTFATPYPDTGMSVSEDFCMSCTLFESQIQKHNVL